MKKYVFYSLLLFVYFFCFSLSSVFAWDIHVYTLECIHVYVYIKTVLWTLNVNCLYVWTNKLHELFCSKFGDFFLNVVLFVCVELHLCFATKFNQLIEEDGFLKAPLRKLQFTISLFHWWCILKLCGFLWYRKLKSICKVLWDNSDFLKDEKKWLSLIFRKCCLGDLQFNLQKESWESDFFPSSAQARLCARKGKLQKWVRCLKKKRGVRSKMHVFKRKEAYFLFTVGCSGSA